MPALQEVQVVEPVVLLKEPAAQGWQVAEPVTSLKRPAGQATAGAVPPAQDEPAGQVVMSVATGTLSTMLMVR